MHHPPGGRDSEGRLAATDAAGAPADPTTTAADPDPAATTTTTAASAAAATTNGPTTDAADATVGLERSARLWIFLVFFVLSKDRERRLLRSSAILATPSTRRYWVFIKMVRVPAAIYILVLPKKKRCLAS